MDSGRSIQEELNAAILEAKLTTASNYIVCIVLTLFVSDWLLNLPDEVKLVWTAPFVKLRTLVFLLVRYPVVVYVAGFLIRYKSLVLCNDMLHFFHSLAVISRLAITVTLGARVYAVSNKSYLIMAILALLAMVVMVGDTVDVAVVTCTSKPRRVVPISDVVKAMARVLFDLIATATTVLCTRATLSLQQQSFFIDKGGVAQLLFHHGLIYFMAVTTLDFLAVILGTLRITARPSLPFIILADIFDTLTLLLSSMLICRFILDLRRMQQHPNFTSMSLPSLPSFRAKRRTIGDSIAEQFGDPLTAPRYRRWSTSDNTDEGGEVEMTSRVAADAGESQSMVNDASTARRFLHETRTVQSASQVEE